MLLPLYIGGLWGSERLSALPMQPEKGGSRIHYRPVYSKAYALYLLFPLLVLKKGRHIPMDAVPLTVIKGVS